MRDIVQECRRSDKRFDFDGNRRTALPESSDDAMRRGASAERMIESRVDCAGIDEVCGTQLLDPAQPLNSRQIEHRRFQIAELYIPVNRVTDH
ncbi:MAG TPA: hypothetical protein VKS43_06015 [Burkholderiales bacterium]|nr:hypothetical protein [Burkholderiales bacterium]